MSTSTTSTTTNNKHPKNLVYSMESLCMKCLQSSGETNFLSIDIPYFHDVIVSSFRCSDESCGHHDVSIVSTAELAPKAVAFQLQINPQTSTPEEIARDLTVIRTESTTISIPEVGFEIPPNRSEINTVDGLLANIFDSLMFHQEHRKVHAKSDYEQISKLCAKFKLMREGEMAFTLSLRDPAGLCFITNPYAPGPDDKCKIVHTDRTPAEYLELGYATPESATIVTEEQRKQQEYKDKMLTQAVSAIRKRESQHLRKIGLQTAVNPQLKLSGDAKTVNGEYKAGGCRGIKMMSSKLLNKKDLDKFENLSSQAMNSTVVFPQTCSSCHGPGETRMCIVGLPYFGDVIVMATSCTHCGFKDSEIKTAQTYAEKGIKIQVKCNSIEDLSRDVLTGPDAAISIPELGLDLDAGVLGAKFTSIEGILTTIHAQTSITKANYTGDSVENDDETKLLVVKFFQQFDQVLKGEMPFTFILDDCAGHSFVEGRAGGVHDSNPFDDDSISITYYTRSKEQDDYLGITDMVTENYYHPQKGNDKNKKKMEGNNDDHKSDNVDAKAVGGEGK